jgi:hypothetical protein
MNNDKILVIGGTKGLGLEIVNKFNAQGIGRSNGYDSVNIQPILELSEKFSIVINCLPNDDQYDVVAQMVKYHSDKNLSTYFITVGSMSYRINDQYHVKNKLVRLNEQLLLTRSSVKHTLINPAELFNTPQTVYCDRISKEEILSTFEFLINTNLWASTIPLIEIRGPLK